METSISTTEPKAPQYVDQSKVFVVAELLEKGIRSTSRLMEAIQCSRPTAIKYRNAAMDLIHNESKPLNREHLRNMEIGRLTYWIEQLTDKINAIEWDTDTGSQEYTRQFEMYNKLLQRIREQADQLHRITGMNTEVQINIDEKRRIVFHRPEPTNATVVEGDVVDSAATKPTV